MDRFIFGMLLAFGVAPIAKAIYARHRTLGELVFALLAIVCAFSYWSAVRDIWGFCNNYPKTAIFGALLLTAAIWALRFSRSEIADSVVVQPTQPDIRTSAEAAPGGVVRLSEGSPDPTPALVYEAQSREASMGDSVASSELGTWSREGVRNRLFQQYRWLAAQVYLLLKLAMSRIDTWSRQGIQTRLFRYCRWFAAQVWSFSKFILFAPPRVDGRRRKRARNTLGRVFAEICLSVSVFVVILVMIFAVPAAVVVHDAAEVGAAAGAGVAGIDWAGVAAAGGAGAAAGKAAEAAGSNVFGAPTANPAGAEQAGAPAEGNMAAGDARTIKSRKKR